ncbi:hypothetical protein AVEN_27178-1 [Araneus ventricosus]|uniref:Uncharacterized protein n=1 Tax=Araneus ventricosus TaxID=182803 RepID=A0A4Y2M125_ARAVE|nr:hypothetical protein AVEN_27178-1 [Araneus ventricosus]
MFCHHVAIGVAYLSGNRETPIIIAGLTSGIGAQEPYNFLEHLIIFFFKNVCYNVTGNEIAYHSPSDFKDARMQQKEGYFFKEIKTLEIDKYP